MDDTTSTHRPHSPSTSQGPLPSASRWDGASALHSARSNLSSRPGRSGFNVLDTKANLTRAKENALLRIPKSSLSATSSFNRFYKTEQMDFYLSAVIDYFQALFRYHKVYTDGKASGDTQQEDQQLIAAREDTSRTLKAVGKIYAHILLVYSNHEKPLVEKNFFEVLYDFTQQVLMNLLDRKYWVAIKKEVGRIFRSDQFSKLNVRTSEPVEQMVPLRKLYSTGMRATVRTEGSEKCAIHRAINARSPLIAILFPTSQDLIDLNISQNDPLPGQMQAGQYGQRDVTSTSLLSDARE
eukprot:TRINITY_DN8604_c0_g1_i5.p1 TRINITY_DN8604_c0_g1~~TRINITY_DN8604_c0_g1_i5.p1  ORF type:complete len:296 (+),score=58.71 TRINITY_DN8604_c0_g1_i5:43-930(+)